MCLVGTFLVFLVSESGMRDYFNDEYQSHFTVTGASPRYRDRETLRRLYYDDGLTQDEIADEFGCSRRTIVDWMDRFDLGPGSDCPKHPLPRLLSRMDPHEIGNPWEDGYTGWSRLYGLTDSR